MTDTMEQLTEEEILKARRKTIFGTNGMQPMALAPFCQAVDTCQVLPIIAQYTLGDFYLSKFTVGFKDPADVLMFKLAFRE